MMLRMMIVHATDTTLITGIVDPRHIFPAQIMTAPAAHLTIGPQRVADAAPPLIAPIPLLENPILSETTTLVIEIIVLSTRITIATALLFLPLMIGINAQFLQMIVAATTDAALDRLTDAVN